MSKSKPDKQNNKRFVFRRGETIEEHSGLTKDQIMIRTFAAMCLPAAASIFAMGTNSLYNILAALLATLLSHYLIRAFELRTFTTDIFVNNNTNCTYNSPYSPLVAGMIVALCVGELTPPLITALIAALTMIVFKWGQEKIFQRKIVNPAAAAKSLVLLIITLMWFLEDPLDSGLIFYPEHLEYALFTEEGFLRAMEYAEQIGFYGTERLSAASSLILLKEHGWIGGASGLLVVISGILLALWIKLKWRITLVYLTTMIVLTSILAGLTGGHLGLRLAFHIFTGSVIFMAFYMATDPKTTPVTWKGQYLFGALLGILTMGLQLAGLFGSSFIALTILNPFHFYLDRLGMKISPVSPLKSQDALKKYLRFPGPSLAAIDPIEEIEPEAKTREIEGSVEECIRCGFCLEVCPKDLHPVLAMEAHEHEDNNMMDHVYPEECINCDLCSYVCPALIKVPEHLDEIRDRMKID